MKNSVSSKRWLPGFTLIEILVTISIIGILGGLVFTGAIAAINRVKIAYAEHTLSSLRTSIGSYYTDYKRYPVPRSHSGERDTVDLATNEELMEILLGARTPSAMEMNPRQQGYFTSSPARRIDATTYIKGLALNDDGSGAGSLWDPWGRLYGIRMDLSNRDMIGNPQHFPPNLSGDGAPEWGRGKQQGQKYPSGSVVGWSAGKEQDISSDNVTSW